LKKKEIDRNGLFADNQTFIMSIQARITTLLSAETYPGGSLTVLVGVTIIFLIWIGNGHPTYKNVPKVSRPLVTSFIDWEPASPFRLQAYEAEGYKKVGDLISQ
jgi:hypothetical protein